MRTLKGDTMNGRRDRRFRPELSTDYLESRLVMDGSGATTAASMTLMDDDPVYTDLLQQEQALVASDQNQWAGIAIAAMTRPTRQQLIDEINGIRAQFNTSADAVIARHNSVAVDLLNLVTMIDDQLAIIDPGVPGNAAKIQQYRDLRSQTLDDAQTALNRRDSFKTFKADVNAAVDQVIANIWSHDIVMMGTPIGTIYGNDAYSAYS